MSAKASQQRRAELATFLRAKRAATVPLAPAGAPSARRRVPGLRREDVARLAGVSYTWYARLEQARAVHPTAQVIDSIARALRLDEDSRKHLRRPAGLPAGEPAETSDQVLGEGLALLHQLLPAPAAVLNACFDYVAWNDAHSAIFYDVGTLPAEQRNALWVTFMVPMVRGRLGDWTGQARSLVAQFRAVAATRTPNERTKAMIRELRRHSREFATWWAEHEVRGADNGCRMYSNPVVGAIRTRIVQLSLVAQPGFKVVAHLPDSAHAAEQLRALSRAERWGVRTPATPAAGLGAAM